VTSLEFYLYHDGKRSLAVLRFGSYQNSASLIILVSIIDFNGGNKMSLKFSIIYGDGNLDVIDFPY
jgi:hypothetical protein